MKNDNKKILALGVLGYLGYKFAPKLFAKTTLTQQGANSDSNATETKGTLASTSTSKCGAITFWGETPIDKAKKDEAFKNIIKNLQNYTNTMLIYRGLKDSTIKIDGLYGACTDKACNIAFSKVWVTPKSIKELEARANYIRQNFGLFSALPYERRMNILVERLSD